jgi:hypothetical protein
MMGNSPQNLAREEPSSIWDSAGQSCFKVAELKERIDVGLLSMDELKQVERNASSELLDLTLSFDNLAASYSTNFQVIKAKLGELEQGLRNLGTNSNAQDATTPRRRVRWENLSLISPDVGSSLDDQMSGLRTPVSDLEQAGAASQGSRELRKLSEELGALSNKVAGTPPGNLGESSATTTQQMSLLQQRVRDMEGRGSKHGFILNEHSFASFAELKIG